MTVKLTNNFFAKARGLIFEDSGSITWSFDPTTNELTAVGSSGGSVTLGNGAPTTLIGPGALYFDLTSGPPLQGYVEVPNNGDPDFGDVVLLLNFDGTNFSTPITDLSPVGNTMTEFNSAALTTTLPKFGTACGNFPNRAGSGWNTPLTTGAPLDLQDKPEWTIECWVKSSNVLNNSTIWSDLGTGAIDYLRVIVASSSGQVTCSPNYSVAGFGSATGPASSMLDGNWHHIVAQASAIAGFYGVAVDGVWGPNTNIISQPYHTNSTPNANPNVYVGYDQLSSAQSAGWVGQIDEMRVTLAQRYTLGVNFTPPAAAFSTVAATDVWEQFGTDVTLTDGSHTISGIKQITVTGGTVGGTSPNATLSIAAGAITVTDGVTTVSGVNDITFSGGVVSGTTPNAVVTISGGGGSGGNVTIDSHPSIPTGVGLGPNDEFETGTSIDTSGARYSGANAWTLANFSGGGNLVVNGGLAMQSGRGTTDNPSIAYQPIASPGSAWQFDCKDLTHQRVSAGDARGGMFLGFASTGQGYLFGRYTDGTFVHVYCNRETSFGSGVTNLFNISAEGGLLLPSFFNQPIYTRLVYDGSSTVFFYWSYDGINYQIGSTETIAAFLTTTTGLDIGLYTDGPGSTVSWDWFRQTV